MFQFILCVVFVIIQLSTCSLLMEILSSLQSAGNVLTGNKFKLKERITLAQCWVADAEKFLQKQVPDESKFVVKTTYKVFHLFNVNFGQLSLAY